MWLFAKHDLQYYILPFYDCTNSNWRQNKQRCQIAFSCLSYINHKIRGSTEPISTVSNDNDDNNDDNNNNNNNNDDNGTI